MRRLLVNADDFGFTTDVNAGILEAHRNGILTATTLMANGEAFDDAVALAKQTPSLDVGVHFVLVGGRSLLSGAPLPQSVPELVLAVAAGRMALFDELSAQASRIIEAGIQPTHADTHKHTHLLSPVCRALCAVAEEFRIPFLRRPADLDLPYRAPVKVRMVNRLVRRRARRLPIGPARTTDHFAGFTLTGRYGIPDLEALFAALPEGSTELMTHPGFLREELRRAPTRLKESREAELRALTAPATRAALDRHGIVLSRYQEL